MSEFLCQICSETFDGQTISKHLHATRHKTVHYNQVTIECEECQDTNIHQLLILRFGMNNMTLLCKPCLEKELKSDGEEPTATYSLSNGALFSKIPQYYTYSNINCKNCHNDKALSIGLLKNEKIISCGKCKDQYPIRNWVSENDDNFLFELLGLKEFIPTKNFKRGQGNGKGRKPRRPAKFDPTQQERKAHYEATKESTKNIKSGTTIKAIGSGVITKHGITGSKSPSIKSPVASKSNSLVSTPRTQSPIPKSIPISKRANEKDSRKDVIVKGPRKATNVKGNPRIDQHSKTFTKDTKFGKSNEISKTNNETIPSKPKTHENQTNKTVKIDKSKPKDNKVHNSINKTSKDESKPPKSMKNSNSTADIESRGSKPLNKPNGASNDKPRGSKSTVANERPKPLKSSGKPDATDSKPISIQKLNKQLNDKSKPIANSKLDRSSIKSVPKETDITNKDTDSVNNEDSMDVVKRFKAEAKPILKYDSLNEYFRHMSFNMFIEEQLTNDDKLIDSEDMLLEWYADDDKIDNQFKISLILSDIKNRFLAEKFKKLKKTPFQVGQSIFLVKNNETPWYGYIATLDLVPAGSGGRSGRSRGRGRGGRSGRGGRGAGGGGGRGRGGSEKNVVEMVIQLYQWNNQPLPISTSVEYLRVLPASVPVTRVFTAMSNLENKNFIKMILGHEPIKQIVFRNYLKFTRDTFNDSQKVAIQSVLNNAITVLQGPPGSGKTSTIYEIILQLLDSLNTYPILVVASSNIAIDNIAEKLLPTHSKNILRIVASEKEREYNKSHPLSSICLHHKVYNSLEVKYKSMIDDIKRGTVNFGATAYKKFLAEQYEVTKVLVAQARVIFTTTVVAGSGQLKSIAKCPVVIMDEATQSSEPTTLIPLSMKGIEKFVFVGDQKQLSCFSLLPSLSLSLFERVLLNGTYKTPHMLDTQYRMHPAISEFPRNRFYGGLLKDGIDASSRQFANIPQNPVYFWDTCGKAREQAVRNRLREDRGYTFTNRGEIEFIIQVVKCLIYEKNVPRSTIGIITPYSGQRDLISSVLVKDDLINPEKLEVRIEVDIDDITNDSKPVTIHMVSEIMIASIDAFQGREKDFLIMGCVRSNLMGTIGFLKDERRLNVALTRAKYGLIMIGDIKTLRIGDKLWNEYLDYLQDKNSIHSDPVFNYI